LKPIQIFAGAHARNHIERNGLKPSDIDVIMGASGGPKWFVLSHLDRYLVQEWLPNIPHQVDMVGSSIGAWRMSAYASSNALDNIEHLEYHYLNQRYSAKPKIKEISQSVSDLLDGFINLDDVNHHELRKLHVVSARSKGIGRFESKVTQTLALASVAASNLASRKSLPYWFDRVVFHSKGGQLPIDKWDAFKTTHTELNTHNYRDALLSSGAIPVVIDGIKNPVGAPQGMYRDGGMVDYHFDLPIKPKNGLVLYPHFMPMLKPGWFDKSLSWRKVKADNYSHTIVVCPSHEFVNSLPYQKIPDRKDFERLDNDTRIKYWQTVVDQNKRIADAFHDWTNSANPENLVESISTIAR
jgi:hypothetical protein